MRCIFNVFCFLCFSLLSLTASGGVYAQSETDIEHLKITADRPAIIPLNNDASSVIIGNPAHAVATLDNPNTLIVNPLRPGVTSLVVLNDSGEVVLERQLLINPPKTNYVKINRVCSVSGRETCRETSVFYCAGGCQEMVVEGQDVQGGQATASDDGGDSVDGESSTESDDQGDGPTPEEFEE